MTDELKNLEVLIVEDSPTQAMFLKELLESHQMKVFVAVDGIDALKVMNDHPASIVVSDIEMPKMNGYELCKIMKVNDALKQIPVILLTSLKDPMDAIRGIECGANCFLTKPCDTNVLLSTIRNAVLNTNIDHTSSSNHQMEFYFGEKKHIIQVNQFQITELLLSTYNNAVQKNRELENAYNRLNQLYDEMKKKNEDLKVLDDQKNKFLGMAAHDIRNPLGAIGTYCDMLLSNPENHFTPRAAKSIEHIKNASTYMLHLINELLDISVIESGTISLNITEVNLASLVIEALEYLTSLADKKQIHLKFKYDENCKKIDCDPDKITQVVINLVSNAIKFSHPGSHIDVKLEQTDLQTTIIVQDYGTGISDATKQRMFEAFAKGSTPGTSGERGTGLGLAIVNKIVNEHKGSIRVESELNKGTTLFVTLPNRFVTVERTIKVLH